MGLEGPGVRLRAKLTQTETPDEGPGEALGTGEDSPLAEYGLSSFQMIPCGLAHRLWVWTLGPLPQTQAAGQGSSSQEHSLFTLPPWPQFPLEPKESPDSRGLAPKLTQSGPLPWVPRHRGTRPRRGWEARVSMASGESGS